MKRMQLLMLVVMGMVSMMATPQSNGETSSAAKPANLAKSLENVYVYWRKAMVAKNYNAWKQVTASHRRVSIQNRILSEKGHFPADVFRLPTAPPSLNGLKLIRARSKGVTAKLVYFGKVDFGIGGKPTDNLLVISYLYEGRGWKYDKAEYINLSGLKDVRAELQAGKLDYVDGEAFLPSGKKPQSPVVVPRPKYIAKVYTYCPGREVKITVNKVSSHRFQDIAQSEVVIGGVHDGMNQIRYYIKDLPGYKGDDPLTVRVYLFSQIKGVKPIKVYQYQTIKGEKPKQADSAVFNITPEQGRRVLQGK